MIKAAGKAAGILTADEAQARRYVENGFTFVAVGTDVGLLVNATSDLVQRFKRGLEPASQSGDSVY